jgi:hypothetical protein
MKITITGAEVSRWPAEMHIMITTCIVCSGCHPWHSADTVHTSHGFDGGRADIDAGIDAAGRLPRYSAKQNCAQRLCYLHVSKSETDLEISQIRSAGVAGRVTNKA